MVEVTKADRDAAEVMLIDLCAPMVEMARDHAAPHFARYRIAAEKAGYERGLRDAAVVVKSDKDRPDYGNMDFGPNVARRIEAAILAKLENK